MNGCEATMKAGSELDGLIAEKVMGWKEDKYRGVMGWLEGHTFHSSFKPSTNIADAWQVVKRMKKKKYKVEIIGTPVKSFCSISDSNYEIAESEAETAPHAICLAAWDAVGGGDYGSS
jgi:hypothetical protein